MALAPCTDQRIPNCLRRSPISGRFEDFWASRTPTSPFYLVHPSMAQHNSPSSSHAREMLTNTSHHRGSVRVASRKEFGYSRIANPSTIVKVI